MRNNVFTRLNRFDLKITNPPKAYVKNRELYLITFIKNVSESLNYHYSEYSIIMVIQ